MDVLTRAMDVATTHTEVKAVRHVRDVEYWKQPYGTVIIGKFAARNMIAHDSEFTGFDRLERVEAGNATGELYDVGYDDEKKKWVATRAGEWDDIMSGATRDQVYKRLEGLWEARSQRVEARQASQARVANKPVTLEPTPKAPLRDSRMAGVVRDKPSGVKLAKGEKGKHEIRLPNGEVAARTSKTRNYSHAVVVTRRKGVIADQREKDAAQLEAATNLYEAELHGNADFSKWKAKDGGGNAKFRTVYYEHPDYPGIQFHGPHFDRRTGKLEDIRDWERNEHGITSHEEAMRYWGDSDIRQKRSRVQNLREEAAKLREGPAEDYYVGRWSASSQLARSATGSNDVMPQGHPGYSARVIAVGTDMQAGTKPDRVDEPQYGTEPDEHGQVMDGLTAGFAGIPEEDQQAARARADAKRKAVLAETQQRDFLNPDLSENDAADIADNIAKSRGFKMGTPEFTDWEKWIGPDGQEYDFGFDEEAGPDGAWVVTKSGEWEPLASSDNWRSTWFQFMQQHGGVDAGTQNASDVTRRAEADAAKERRLAEIIKRIGDQPKNRQDFNRYLRLNDDDALEARSRARIIADTEGKTPAESWRRALREMETRKDHEAITSTDLSPSEKAPEPGVTPPKVTPTGSFDQESFRDRRERLLPFARSGSIDFNRRVRDSLGRAQLAYDRGEDPHPHLVEAEIAAKLRPETDWNTRFDSTHGTSMNPDLPFRDSQSVRETIARNTGADLNAPVQYEYYSEKVPGSGAVKYNIMRRGNDGEGPVLVRTVHLNGDSRGRNKATLQDVEKAVADLNAREAAQHAEETQYNPKKIIERMKVASSREEAAKYVEGLSAAQLREVAKEGNIAHPPKASKKEIADTIVHWTAGRRLDSAAVSKPAEPAAEPSTTPFRANFVEEGTGVTEIPVGTFGDPEKMQNAMDRQQAIDHVRPIAELGAEMEELVDNETPKAILVERFNAFKRRRPDLATDLAVHDMGVAIEKASFGLPNKRGEKKFVDDVRRILSEHHNVELGTKAGESEPFNPKKHANLGGGHSQTAHIIRPSVTYTRDGEEITIAKAVTADMSPEDIGGTHVPAPVAAAEARTESGGDGLPTTHFLAARKAIEGGSATTTNLNALDTAIRTGKPKSELTRLGALVDDELGKSGIPADQGPRKGIRDFLSATYDINPPDAPAIPKRITTARNIRDIKAKIKKGEQLSKEETLVWAREEPGNFIRTLGDTFKGEQNKVHRDRFAQLAKRVDNGDLTPAQAADELDGWGDLQSTLATTRYRGVARALRISATGIPGPDYTDAVHASFRELGSTGAGYLPIERQINDMTEAVRQGHLDLSEAIARIRAMVGRRQDPALDAKLEEIINILTGRQEKLLARMVDISTKSLIPFAEILDHMDTKGLDGSAEYRATKGMIALIPSVDDALRLALPDGEIPEELHITMMFLGDADNYDDRLRGQIVAAMTNVALGRRQIETPPFAVNVFNPNGEKPCLVLGLGGRELSYCHDLIVDTMREGVMVVPPPDEHYPWIPHMTLKYAPLDELMYDIESAAELCGEPIVFDRLRVAFAGDVTDIPLGAVKQPSLMERALYLASGVRDPGDRHDIDGQRYTTPDLPSRSAYGEKGWGDWESKGIDKLLAKDHKCKYCKSPASKLILHSEGMAYVATCGTHFGKGKAAAAACVPYGGSDPSNIDKVYDLKGNKSLLTRPKNPKCKYCSGKGTNRIPLGDGRAKYLCDHHMGIKAITPGGRIGDPSSRNLSPRENWVDKRGGMPRYIKMVRNALLREGHSMGKATALAVAAIKRWARGGDHVTPKVQAAAAKALAQWEAMKAAS